MKFWIVTFGEYYEAGYIGVHMHTDRDAAIAEAKSVKAPCAATTYDGRHAVNVNLIDWSEVNGFDTDAGTKVPFEIIEDHEL
jgi:hypothetical protein